ncbi:hypothetical protein NL676_023802 [Syzygium grande]|nr:hypothetical protein NL676_023802 [Syzygium grande]
MQGSWRTSARDDHINQLITSIGSRLKRLSPESVNCCIFVGPDKQQWNRLADHVSVTIESLNIENPSNNKFNSRKENLAFSIRKEAQVLTSATLRMLHTPQAHTGLLELAYGFFRPATNIEDVPEVVMESVVQHFLDTVRLLYLPSVRKAPCESEEEMEFIPSATELVAAGVKLRRGES